VQDQQRLNILPFFGIMENKNNMKKYFLLVFVLLFLFFCTENDVQAITSPDLTGDTKVNAMDFAVLLKTTGATVQDFLLVLTNYGKTVSVILTPTPTLTVGPTITPTATPSGPSPTPAPIVAGEWTQFGHDAAHTGYTDQVVATPWKWKWAWNGPNTSGKVTSGKFSLPRNVQPVTGTGRVYIASGSNGIYALNDTNGSVVWNKNPGGSINSTVAYDSTTGSIFAVSSNGTLYKLDAATGNTTGQFAGSGTSTLPLPPSVISDRVFFSMGNFVYAVNKSTMSAIWSYNAGSPVEDPPAYSASKNMVIAVSHNLNLHAINNATGVAFCNKKLPTVRNGGSPEPTNKSQAEILNGWPVVADVHGFVLVKLRLDWDTIWTPWSPWPVDNTTIQNGLKNTYPEAQALMAIDLNNQCNQAFVANIGHGGQGDGGYEPMGPQPVVKRFSDGKEVVYTIIRGTTYYDGRWDSNFGEMVLDNTTVCPSTGNCLQPGYVRWIQYSYPPGGTQPYLISDEQPYVTMSGNYLFGGHWMAGLSLQITDRSAAKGSFTNRISSTNAPTIITSTSSCSNGSGHYCSTLVQDGDPRSFTAGFYIYSGAGTVYDQYWTEFQSWVVSNQTVYYRSTDGAIIALQNGNPTADNASAQVAGEQTDVINQTSDTLDIPVFSADSFTKEDALKYIGKTVRLQGAIRYIFNNGKSVLFGFHYPHQAHPKIQIKKEFWPNFSQTFGSVMGRNQQPLYQEGDSVEVTGNLDWYQGDPTLYVTDPTQITITTHPAGI
jgi:hypothetical protein